MATTVTVHTVPAGRFADGVSVKLVAPPGGTGATVKVSDVPVGHSSLKAVPVTLTALLKLTTTVVDASTDVAPLVGVVLLTVGGESVVKEAVEFAAMCVPARLAICAATAVATQVVPAGRFAEGVSVNVVAPPGGDGESVNAFEVPEGHSRVKAEAVTFTAALKVNDTVVFRPTLVAPLVGVVLDTVGGASTVNEKT